ncbi:tetratricopeptide repeat protein [Actinomadura violacea]|uniref:Tetratricopeptide repeat protein n=1 Tax=Actinomadura violacea TaxID=2819934 RepID=A0ABS3RHY3_9ACTN|nr:tetratricopeptide repeat protein [Actinomadura violacea]MBO2456345.1 tetratricopeptide repeat protein [Actinomadura violacea]
MVNPTDDAIESGSGASAGRDIHQDGQFVAGRDTHIGTMSIHYHQPEVPAPRSPVSRLRRRGTTFIGRAAERASLREWMDYDRNPFPLANVLNGPGSGKTSLALQVARDVAPSYPGGQLFLELSQVGLPELDVSEALFRLLLQLEVPESRIPGSLAGRIELFHAELRKPTLLVLDSVTSARQVMDLLPSRADCGVLMTSRRSFSELEDIREMDLGNMTDDEAYALLEARIGADRVAADPVAARRIIELCGGLPLALHMAGAQLTKPASRRMPLARFADRLAAERLDLLKTDHLDLRTSFSLSYRELSPQAARHFRLLSQIAVSDFGDALAAAVDGTGAWEDTLAELFNTHLIEPVGQDRARFHDLVKVFAQERAETEDAQAEREAAVDRAMAWALETAAGWGRHIGVDGRRTADGDAYAAALDGLDGEHATLSAIVRQAAATGRDDVPWRVVSNLAGFFEIRGHWADWLEGAELAVESASRLNDAEALGVARHMRSWPLRESRRLTEAIEESVAALSLLQGVPGAEVSRADVLSHLGTLYRETHRYDEAEDCLRQAVEIFRAAADAHGEGLVLRTLGHVQFWRRDLDDAAATLTRAVDLLRSAGDRAAEGWSHNNLTSVRGAQWRYTEAERHHQQALNLFEQIEHRQGQAWAHNHLGRILRQYGRTDEAVEHNREALRTFEDIGDLYGKGWALLHLGAALQDIDRLQSAQQIFAAMDVPEHEGLGTSLMWQGHFLGDAAALNEAIGYFEVVGSLTGHGSALRERADIERAAGDVQAAARSYEEALTYLRRAADPHGEALALLGLAGIDPEGGHAMVAEAIMARLGLRIP